MAKKRSLDGYRLRFNFADTKNIIIHTSIQAYNTFRIEQWRMAAMATISAAAAVAVYSRTVLSVSICYELLTD